MSVLSRLHVPTQGTAGEAHELHAPRPLPDRPRQPSARVRAHPPRTAALVAGVVVAGLVAGGTTYLVLDDGSTPAPGSVG